MSTVNAAEIKSVIMKMKDSDKPVAYAFGLGDKPETCGFVLHRTKKPSAMLTEMKGGGDFKKVGCGTILVKGKELHITEIKPIAGLDRKLLKLLKANGLKYAPVLAVAGADAADAADGGDDAKAKEEAEKVLAEIEDLAKKVDALLAEVG